MKLKEFQKVIEKDVANYVAWYHKQHELGLEGFEQNPDELDMDVADWYEDFMCWWLG